VLVTIPLFLFYTKITVLNRICCVETQGLEVDILRTETGVCVREGTETVDDLELPQVSAWIYCLLSYYSHLLSAASETMEPE
jgi:hypothetical protein